MGSYVPNTLEERKKMLQEIGYSSIEDLFAHIPEEVKLKGELNIPKGKTEFEVRREMEQIAEKNQVFRTIFRGAGAYRHFIPAMVKNVTSKENLLTAYTPYQAEISQGILQSIFEYQTMICDLTGMDVSNASVYDGATAAAEGVAMCQERKRHKALISGTVPPYVLEVVETYCFGNGMELEVIPEKDGLTDKEYLKEHIDAQTACVYIQHPNYYGNLEDAEEIGEIVHDAGAKYVMGVNPISLGVIKTPAEYGADVAVGEGQPLGLSIAFGGPYLGFMAATQKMMRNLPGRIVGQTEDHNGKKGYVLTLQAREQHIRREKASSNICSNQALCALAVGVYLATMGNEGIKKAATLSTSKAHYLSAELAKVGYQTENKGEFFHEFVTVSDVPAAKALAALEEKGILGGTQNPVVLYISEYQRRDGRSCSDSEGGAVMLIFEKSRPGRGCDLLPECDVEVTLPQEKDKREKKLHLPELSEIELSRHYTELAKKSHGVNDGFYPLGSCTMKYNPKINEDMAALPGFTEIHPLQPTHTVQGCLEVIKESSLRDHRYGSYDIPAGSRCSRRIYRTSSDQSIS